MKTFGWLGLLVAGALLYLVGHLDGIGSRHDRDLDRQTASALQLHRSAERQLAAVLAAHLQAEAARTELRGVRVARQRSADSLRQRGVALEQDLRGSLAGADSLGIYRQLVATVQAENRELRAVIDAAAQERVNLAADRDRWKVAAIDAGHARGALAAALEAEHEARKCRILRLISCPSRKTVAFVAGVVGFAVGYVSAD